MGVPLHLMLLQIFPIVIFLVVDALVEDPAWAIGSALGFVFFQALGFWIRKKKFDAFILVDFGLIAGMGGISLLTHDELFFKLKPAVIEGLMVPYLLFLALAREGTLQAYFARYATGIRFHPAATMVLRRLLGLMAIGVLLHAAAVVACALWASRSTWGWVSGPGFYLLLVPLAGWALVERVRARRNQKGMKPSASMSSKSKGAVST